MAKSRPNIVLVMCDQMRWDAAGFAGSSIVQTPHLDGLSEGGVCFENAYCASPVCSPARASWFDRVLSPMPICNCEITGQNEEKIGEGICRRTALRWAMF